jgi:hypothetical protein
MLILLLTLVTATAALAADVSVELAGGEVAGAVSGQGTASVVVDVTNNGLRDVTGLRIAAYYSTVNAPPVDPETAGWRIHEFVFDPPLAPGQSITVRFRDENAAEYVLLESRFVVEGGGIIYNGRTGVLEHGLRERSGVTYIATRDLIDLIGGGISYDAASYEVVIERQGVEVRFKEGHKQVKVNGQVSTFDHAIVEIDGRSLLPLVEFCGLLGITVEHDTAVGLFTLSD